MKKKKYIRVKDRPIIPFKKLGNYGIAFDGSTIGDAIKEPEKRKKSDIIPNFRELIILGSSLKPSTVDLNRYKGKEKKDNKHEKEKIPSFFRMNYVHGSSVNYVMEEESLIKSIKIPYFEKIKTNRIVATNGSIASKQKDLKQETLEDKKIPSFFRMNYVHGSSVNYVKEESSKLKFAKIPNFEKLIIPGRNEEGTTTDKQKFHEDFVQKRSMPNFVDLYNSNKDSIISESRSKKKEKAKASKSIWHRELIQDDRGSEKVHNLKETDKTIYDHVFND